jgi:hypothetical protein
MSLDAHDMPTAGSSVEKPKPHQGRTVPAKGDQRVRRHRRSNDIFAGIHRNSSMGRRIVDLTADYMQLLGNPTSLTQQAAIVAAVELQVLSEVARAAALEAMPPTMDMLDQVVRLQAASARAARRLGLDKPQRKPDGPSLDAYLAKREVSS